MTTDKSAAPERLDADRLAQIIRTVDGDNTLGAGELAERILALIDTPAPPTPSESAGDALRGALREALTRDLNALRAAASRGPVSSREIFQMTDPMMDRLSRAALAAAPAPQPAPADREALVEVIRSAMIGLYPGRGMARGVADALLADGWRKPTDAQPETRAWAVVGEENRILVARIYPEKSHVWKSGCERIVPVAIRIVEDEA